MGSVPIAFETTVRVNDKYEARYDLLPEWSSDAVGDSPLMRHRSACVLRWGWD
jgi:hypothetical protein